MLASIFLVIEDREIITIHINEFVRQNESTKIGINRTKIMQSIVDTMLFCRFSLCFYQRKTEDLPARFV